MANRKGTVNDKRLAIGDKPTVRAFVALELDNRIQIRLGEIQEKLKKSGVNIRWVKPENIHLTMKFLGQITSGQIEQIKRALEETAETKKPFFIGLGKLGTFPKPEHPKVIWAGIKEGCKETIQFDKELEARLQTLGFTPEAREFRPHLTLGRIRLPHQDKKSLRRLKEIILFLNSQTAKPLKTLAAQVTLFQSTLTPEGSAYTPLHKVFLR